MKLKMHLKIILQMSKRGGARTGAGRPSSLKKRVYQCRLTDRDAMILDDIKRHEFVETSGAFHLALECYARTHVKLKL